MPFDPSGNFTRLHSWQNDRDSGIHIMADRHDEEDDNFAAAFNQVFMRNGLIPMTNSLQMGGNHVLGVAPGSVTAPGLTFNLDANTGLYQPGVAQLGVGINGNQIGLWTATGLQVTGDVTATGNFNVSGITATGDLSVANLTVTGNTVLNTATVSGSLSVTGDIGTNGQVWAQNGHFNAVVYSNGINNTGTIGTTSSVAVASPGNGQVLLNLGGANNTGYISFQNASGARKGYIGFIPFAGGGGLQYQNENGGPHVFNTNMQVNGQQINLNNGAGLWQHDGGNGYFRSQVGGLYLGANANNNMLIQTDGNVQTFGNIFVDGAVYPGYDTQFYIALNVAGGPGFGFNPNCWLNYNRGTGALRFVVNNTEMFTSQPGLFQVPNGCIIAGAGNAANPAYRTTADNDTGMFGEGDGLLSFSANGVRSLRVGGAGIDVWGTVSCHGVLGSDTGNAALQYTERDNNSIYWLIYAQANTNKLWHSTTGDCFLYYDTAFEPVADGNAICGAPGHRWSSVWCMSSSMTTSDAREKRWRGGLTDVELAVSKELVKEIGIYQWLRDLDTEGEAAKLQCGILAQTAISIFEANGLNALDYGFVSYSEWEESIHHDENHEEVVTPSGNRYSIMLPDLIAFMMVGQEQRLSALEQVMLR